MTEIPETRYTNFSSGHRNPMRIWERIMCWGEQAKACRPVPAHAPMHAGHAGGMLGRRSWGRNFYSVLQVLRGKLMTANPHRHDS